MPDPIEHLVVRRAESSEDLESCVRVRLQVFVEEQGVPKELEMDALDAQAVHYLATIDSEPVGVARRLIHGSHAKIGRVAVLKQWRRKGIGQRIMKHILAEAQHDGLAGAELGAQVWVIGFYEELGFSVVSDEFLDAGIPHREMVLIF